VGGVSAALAVAAAAREGYRRTLGRRRDRYARLARLGTGTHLSFFEAVLGEPPAIRRTVTKNVYEYIDSDDPRYDPALADPDDDSHELVVPAEFVECIFVDRDYYVQTVSDFDDTVLAFSVTTRRRRFRPRFQTPPNPGLRERIRWRRESGEGFKPLFKVRLGRTTFDELDDDDPDDFAPPHFRAESGARMARYAEFAYFGNPGFYLTYVFSANIAWPGRAPWELIQTIVEEAGHFEWPYPLRPDPAEPDEAPDPAAEPDWEQLRAVRRFRREAVITTVTVMHPNLWTENFPTTFGPHGDEVRLIP
jgi:hypothetical protein